MKMKKVLFLIMVLLLLVVITGCRSNNSFDTQYDEDFQQYNIYPGVKDVIVIFYYDNKVNQICDIALSLATEYSKVYTVKNSGKSITKLTQITDSILAQEKTENGTNLNFYLGGFSSGNETATQIFCNNPDDFYGLLLYGATLNSKSDLSEINKKILCMYGQYDTVLTPDDIMESKQYYSSDAYFYEIYGGNHTQMLLPYDSSTKIVYKDSDATITARNQKIIICDETLDFIYSNKIQEGINNG